MKEDLVELKELAVEYSNAKKSFEEKKAFFDQELEKKVVIFPTKGELSTYEFASYEVACKFYEKYPFIQEYDKKLNINHPRYGEKRFKETLIKMIENTEGCEDFDMAVSSMVNTHLDFKNHGFYDVRLSEAKMNTIASKLAEKVIDVKEEKIDTTVKKVADAVENIKPYGEQVKSVGGKVIKRLIKLYNESFQENNEE